MRKQLKTAITSSKYLRRKIRKEDREETRKLQKDPILTIERSKLLITSKYPWIIDESTFQVIDDEYCVWAACVTTTFRKERNMEELTFPIIVCEKEVFSELDIHNLKSLGEWCLRQGKNIA